MLYPYFEVATWFGTPHASDWSDRNDALGDRIKDCGVGHVDKDDGTACAGSCGSDAGSIIAQPKPD